VTATDPDGNNITLSATDLPSGATFTPSTGVFSWTPGYPTAGVYTPTFTATDDGSPVASSSQDVVITVGSNPTPTEQAQTLVNNVVAANFPTNQQNAYLATSTKLARSSSKERLSRPSTSSTHSSRNYSKTTLTASSPRRKKTSTCLRRRR
jgi:hypothetical protein